MPSAISSSGQSRRGAVSRVWRAAEGSRRQVVSGFWFSSISPPISVFAVAVVAARHVGIGLAQDAGGGPLGGEDEGPGSDLLVNAPQFQGFTFVIGAQPA